MVKLSFLDKTHVTIKQSVYDKI